MFEAMGKISRSDFIEFVYGKRATKINHSGICPLLLALAVKYVKCHNEH